LAKKEGRPPQRRPSKALILLPCPRVWKILKAS